MGILEKEKLTQYLYDHYCTYWGNNNSDIWYDQPAVNVWVFCRGNKIITLKAHILTGEVTETVEELSA